MNHPEHFDVAIVGAGPAGSTCALALRNSGLRVSLIDKAVFPREKVCGDAIPSRAIKVLGEICPDFRSDFSTQRDQLPIKKTVIHFRDRKLSHTWKLDACTCRRSVFDTFLLACVREKTATTVLEGTEIREICTSGTDYRLDTPDGRPVLSATLLVGADGFNGVVSRFLASGSPAKRKQCQAICRYYKGITGVDPVATEIYLDRAWLPGYFWIFPLAGGLFNVGFGMMAGYRARRNINLQTAFSEMIRRSAILGEKFRDAAPVSPFRGSSIPLGFPSFPVSGDHFLLTGDAASLVDPLSGDGIGNAVLSGKLAADQIIRSFASGDFSRRSMKNYDRCLCSILRGEMKRKEYLVRLLTRMPVMMEWIF